MDSETAFISSLLGSNRGTQDDFWSKQLPLSVFSIRDKEMAWLYRYRQQNGKFPKPETFMRKWDDIELVPVDDPLSTTLEPVLAQAAYVQIKSIVDDTQQQFANKEDALDILERFKESTAKLSSYSLASVDEDMRDPRVAFRRYKNAQQEKEVYGSLVTSPWPKLNRLLTYSRPGEVIVITARTGLGKALAMDEKILTPTGWVLNKDLKVGDSLASVDGKPNYVTAIYPQGRREFYTLTFSDGRTAECSDEHLWEVYCAHWKSWRVIPVTEIVRLLSLQRYTNRLSIRTFTGNYSDDSVKLPIHPYVLGALLGDGCFVSNDIRFTSADTFLVNKVNKLLPSVLRLRKIKNSLYDYAIVGEGRGVRGQLTIKSILRDLNLHKVKSNQKHIPSMYLKSSYSSRLSLLQGLLDTDGTAHLQGKPTTNSVAFCTTSKQLAEQVRYLVRSLGGLAYISRKSTKHLPAYVIMVRLPNQKDAFSLPRKKSLIQDTSTRHNVNLLTIKSVKRSNEKECQCISVSHSSHLFIMNDFVVTHNTWMLLCWMDYLAAMGIDTLVVSKEMPTPQISDRISAIKYQLDWERFRAGTMSIDELLKWKRQLMIRRPYPLVVTGEETMDGIGVEQVYSKIEKMKPRVAAIDGAYLMSTKGVGKNAGEREVMAALSRACKRIAKATQTTLFVVLQNNRTAEKDGLAKGVLTSVYGSDAWSQDADVQIELSGERGSNERAVIVHKSRESNLGDLFIDFKLSPRPSFKEKLSLSSGSKLGSLKFNILK